MTAVDLDALDKLRGAAAEHGVNFPWRQDSGWGENILGADGDQIGAVEWPTDAALIVAAVNALPDLIAEARRYRELRGAVEDVAYDLRSYVITRGKPQSGSYDDGANRAQTAVATDLLALVATVDET